LKDAAALVQRAFENISLKVIKRLVDQNQAVRLSVGVLVWKADRLLLLLVRTDGCSKLPP
jgi:hypothetical protein